MGLPLYMVLKRGGKALGASAPVASSRSAASMKCWVPILLEGNRPERIHLRIVSGFFPVLRAASGTLSIVDEYYYK